MHITFTLDAPGLAGARFMVERERLAANGDVETAFFDRAGPLVRHNEAPAGRIAAALAADPEAKFVVAIRNPKLVLDAALPSRIATALAALDRIDGPWSIAAAGGLAMDGARVCALYSAEFPFLPVDVVPRPLTDPMPDLWIAEAGFLRSLIQRGRALPDTGLETALAMQGYLDGRVAVFAPELTAGIDGPLRSRDPERLTRALRDWFDGAVAEATVETLMGPVVIDAKPGNAAAMAHLRAAFVNLDLRLQVNPPQGHSRVTNLLGGLSAATKAHVAVMDDDDYVDLFAFDEMRRALFLGAKPLMVTGAQVHEEDWVETPSGRHLLVKSTERTTYPVTGWRNMFAGVNRLPVCALVMPRQHLMARLQAFDFAHDLSEDYALALAVLTDPQLPPIAEIPGTFGHISLRPTEGQSIALEDRRPWCRDIAFYLADLTRNAAVAGPGKWALLARGSGAGESIDRQAIAELQQALAARERQIRLLTAEVVRLRTEPANPAPAVAAEEAAA